MNKQNFPQPDSKKSIASTEEEILKYWKEQKIFEKTISSRSPRNNYVFFDGPPFATGLPHYGHILAGAIKDAIPRYKTMQGYRITRKWGWDCHGVPVEFQVEKEHKIGGKPGIEKMGVGKFNELCRSVVMRCASDWEKTVDRMGRFVDFKDDYKTMDPEFMESVWWVFGELWKKGLIYEGEKVVAYSPKLGSPLSNFEANLNYKDVADPAVTVKFEVIEPGFKSSAAKSNPGSGVGKTYFLAWTTTPWTLPSNLALAVHPKLEYVKVKIPKGRDEKGTPQYENIILAKNVFEKSKQKGGSFFSEIGRHFEYDSEIPEGLPAFEDAHVVETYKGKDLVGKHYKPLFDFYKDHTDHEKSFRVLEADYVSAEDGTGIVHQAPNFGEDDAKVCFEAGIKPLKPQPIDESGFFQDDMPEGLAGAYFRKDPEIHESLDKNANTWVIDQLKEKELLFKIDNMTHSYPHCWRSDCALMYRGVKTWFVDVQKVKKLMVEQNKKVNWIPDHLRDGRFGKLLEAAPDWAISRNRFWGTPIPVWRCDACKETQVISSRAELEKLTGAKVDDLHKHFVDDLTWKCPKCTPHPASPQGEEPQMRRIPEVLDCWFESGAMPYASVHYPFKGQNLEEIKEAVEKAERKTVSDFFKKIWEEKFKLNVDFEKEEKQNPRLFFIKKEKLIVAAAYIDQTQEKENIWKLCRIGVLDAYQRRGFGELLSDHVLFLARKNNIEKIVLSAEKNTLGFYKKLGFSETGESCKMGNNECLEMELSVEKYVSSQLTTKYQIPNTEFQSADFIAEGLDQTRGWFYTLHVLGCALFGKNIYKNVITNGIILAEDGQKMSKSKKNYPDPNLVFDKYGADAMRFYLLSSPVVRGENFRFAEHGVAEVLKQIILPIRSSYQFFSTYANIDGWKPTKLVTVRHGEGDHNVQKIYSGVVENAHHLTAKGKKDVAATAATIEHCDVMYASPFVRTQETAAILKKEMKFAGEIQTDERIQESGFGDLEGTQVGSPVCRFQHTNKGVEPQKDVIDRFKNFIEEKSKDHRGKTVVVVTHGDGFRAMTSVLDGVAPTPENWRMIPMPRPAESHIFFAKPKPEHELDKWILSEFQSLLRNYREKMDAYQIDGALQGIAPFIDQLNNWYLRRSRTRFWANGMSEDKHSAYETLHYILMTFSKILAPVCPFFAEKLYQDLTGGESVHLEFFPYAQKEFVDEKLNAKINIAREIVTLAAGIRARQKIKLRQPLQKLQFFCKNAKDVDAEVVKAEANVKEIEILTEKSLADVAKKIVRVDAKQVGRKFGKKVQELIKAGKEGAFKENADGSVEIAGERLEVGEFAVGFLTQEGVEADSTPNAVVVLDTELTDELKLEGTMREVIRAVQDLRKTSGFEVSDRIEIIYSTDSEVLKSAFATHSQRISKEVLAESITEKANKGEAMEIDGEKVVLELKKV